MNARLIANWNDIVRPDDTVNVHADVDMHARDATLTLVSELAGPRFSSSATTVPAGPASATAGCGAIATSPRDRRNHGLAVTAVPPLRGKAPVTGCC